MFKFFSALWEYREELLLVFSILFFLKGGEKVCGRQARKHVEGNAVFYRIQVCHSCEGICELTREGTNPASGRSAENKYSGISAVL